LTISCSAGDTILIGDANGADKAVQEYLAASGYRNVTVYCMEQCRNNAGAWPTRNVKPPGARKDFAYYAAKDLVMAEEARCGVMLWDAKSKGTLNNMVNLVGAGKRDAGLLRAYAGVPCGGIGAGFAGTAGAMRTARC
jgi:adenine-specific DNA-methyltransferase